MEKSHPVNTHTWVGVCHGLLTLKRTHFSVLSLSLKAIGGQEREWKGVSTSCSHSPLHCLGEQVTEEGLAETRGAGGPDPLCRFLSKTYRSQELKKKVCHEELGGTLKRSVALKKRMDLRILTGN